MFNAFNISVSLDDFNCDWEVASGANILVICSKIIKAPSIVRPLVTVPALVERNREIMSAIKLSAGAIRASSAFQDKILTRRTYPIDEIVFRKWIADAGYRANVTIGWKEFRIDMFEVPQGICKQLLRTADQSGASALGIQNSSPDWRPAKTAGMAIGDCANPTNKVNFLFQ